jgi:putative FmdB family regulatory protein
MIMPLYDYDCTLCEETIEVFHKMAEEPKYFCARCKNQMTKAMTTGAVKRQDATWITQINGTINDLGEVHAGRQENITTREQARSAINKTYSDPHPRVQELRKRYLERY